MARYKAAIDAGGDLAEIGPWISEAKAQRVQAETELRQATSRARLTRQQIQDLISTAVDVAATLNDADPAGMADAYDKLGVRRCHRRAPRVPRGAGTSRHSKCSVRSARRLPVSTRQIGWTPNTPLRLSMNLTSASVAGPAVKKAACIRERVSATSNAGESGRNPHV